MREREKERKGGGEEREKAQNNSIMLTIYLIHFLGLLHCLYFVNSSLTKELTSYRYVNHRKTKALRSENDHIRAC